VSDEPIHPDDLAILALFAALERQPVEGDLLGRPMAGDVGDVEGAEGESETLVRLYTEVLGLVPYELAPAAPPAALKARLMTIVSGDETQDVEPFVLSPLPTPSPAAATPTPAPPAVQRTAPTPAMGIRPPAPGTMSAMPAIPAPVVPTPIRSAPVRRASRWPLALAAALILALLGVSGYLYQGLREQGEVISQLTRERNQLIVLEREHARALSTGDTELTGLKGEMNAMQSRLALITSPGVEISPLHPTGKVPMPPDAYGMLFVAADHQHWDLAIRGLSPSGNGRQYQLWFIAPQGPVSGGTFTAAPGAPVNLSSAHMPAGTRAVIITLEPEAGTQTPSGPEVLRAAAPVKVL
jgi:hypothetical protein